MTTIHDVTADPKRPYKAYAATALAFITIVLSAWISDDGGVSGKEIVAWLISGAIGAGLTGGATFQAKNPKILKSRGGV